MSASLRLGSFACGLLTGCMLLFCLLPSCSRHAGSQYRISSDTVCADLDGYKVSLLLNGRTIDSTYVKDGHFEMSGRYADSFSHYLSYIEYGGSVKIPLIVGRDPLTVDLVKKKVYGDTLNEELQSLNEKLRRVGAQFKRTLSANATPDPLFDAFGDNLAKAIDQYAEICKGYAHRHPNDPVGVVAVLSLMTLDQGRLLPIAKYVQQSMGVVVKEHPEVKHYLRLVDNYYRTQPGCPMIDLTLMDLSEHPVEIRHDMQSNGYTLLHFWSGWCKPCIDELENIRKIYKRYSPKGLSVVSIYVWDEYYYLQLLVEENQLDWTQRYDHTGEAPFLYGVIGVPETILIAPNDTIVARSLRGSALVSKLDSIFS